MLPQFDPPPSATHEEQVTVTNTPLPTNESNLSH